MKITYSHRPLMKIYMVNVDLGVYHDDCKQYEQLLHKVISGRSPKDALVYCYKKIESGFAAKLTYEEAVKLKGEKGIFEVVEQKIYLIDVMKLNG
ncbi:hypothetical protein AALP_AAs67532U000100 [Arabis alpina]|uniref:Inhibitor I9 domain-containing protein n=1 Tax=Arabis alpina TaxID=50452 RepID=A0A087G3Y0_ARAAL|nr:hypothetical protein AALP_AAs67532U000100 [Arabis alpina]